MAYVKKDYRTIYESLVTDLKGRLPGIGDFEQGSVIRSLLETLSFEQAIFYEQLDYVYNSSFVNTADATNLEKVVAILDIKRGEPDFAIGSITFIKDTDFEKEVTIPIGTLLTTEDNSDETPQRKAYRTIEEAILLPDDREATVKVQAETRGPEMEAKGETVIVMPIPIEGISEVINREPIAFIGRNRETDEELRDRAKKTLLAAGKASEISIEYALLSMPNILDVKIEEPKNDDNEPIPGVINVYVDGLTASNSQSLARRLDEVKAAGIYTRLKAADITEVTAILKLIPHESVIEKEIPELEKQVAAVFKKYIEGKKMGQPISITQLTTEVLKVKGVQDLDRYDITLKDQAKLLDPPTVDQSGPDPDTLDIKYFEGIKDGLEQYSEPENLKAIKYSDFGRFAVQKLRIAAGEKKLPIQIQLKLKYPNETSRLNIKGKLQAELDKLDFTIQQLKDPNLPVSNSVFNDFLSQVNAYFQSCKTRLITNVEELRVDPIKEKYSDFYAYIKEKSGLFKENLPPSKFFNLNEEEIKGHLYTSIVKSQMKEAAKEGVEKEIQAIANSCAGSFPESQLFSKLLTAVTSDLTNQIDSIRREIGTINQEISDRRLKLLSKDFAADETKQDVEAEIKTRQQQLDQKQTSMDSLQNKVNNVTSGLQALVESWSRQTKEKFESLMTKSSSLVSATGKLTDFDLSLRLRTYTFEFKEYFRQPIPVSFIEKPVFDYLWVYTKDLRIAGDLKLSLPVTATDQEKQEVYTKVREAVNKVLYNQRPEADIRLTDLLDAAKTQKLVLGAKFDASTLGLVEDQKATLQLIPDRVTDEVLKVKASEKVLLSDQFFNIS